MEPPVELLDLVFIDHGLGQASVSLIGAWGLGLGQAKLVPSEQRRSPAVLLYCWTFNLIIPQHSLRYITSLIAAFPRSDKAPFV